MDTPLFAQAAGDMGPWPLMMQWGAVGVLVLLGLAALRELKKLTERTFAAFETAAAAAQKRNEDQVKLFNEEVTAVREQNGARFAALMEELAEQRKLHRECVTDLRTGLQNVALAIAKGDGCRAAPGAKG